jgi:hypothetical protein
MKLVCESLNEFKRGEDVHAALNIGVVREIKSFFDRHNDSLPTWGKDRRIDYHIGEDLVVDLQSSFHLDPFVIDTIERETGEEYLIPKHLKFGEVRGHFSIVKVKNLPSLDFFPETIGGDLIFFENNIRLTEKKLEALGTFVKGDIKLLSAHQEAAKEYRATYKERGPRSQRIDHDLGRSQYSHKYSLGYKLYKALEYIKSKGQEGARYWDIIKLIHSLSHPTGGEPTRGWGVGYFSPVHSSPIGTRADKNKAGRWVINSKGEKYLDEHRDLFEDQ